MHETADDLDELQRLLDATYERAGAHLRSLATPERRLTAAAVASVLEKVCILDLATVTSKGEPRVSPVDGLFYRGRFWFGSSPTSLRFRHIAQRPQVSAAHTRGEKLAVIVHGAATVVDLGSDEGSGFRSYVLEVYGGDWEDWGAGATYARIDATHMHAFGFDDLAGSGA